MVSSILTSHQNVGAGKNMWACSVAHGRDGSFYPAVPRRYRKHSVKEEAVSRRRRAVAENTQGVNRKKVSLLSESDRSDTQLSN